MYRIITVAITAILIVFFSIPNICLAMQHKAEATGHSDMSLVKETKNKLFQLTIYTPQDGFKVGINELKLIIKAENGSAVTGANVSIKPWMPSMGHGVLGVPIIKETGAGIYTATNIGFSMSGLWQLMITVSQGGKSDEAIFEFSLADGNQDMENMQEHAGHDMTQHFTHMASSFMGLHNTHSSKGWMFQYRFMRMDMDGLLVGTDSIQPIEVTGTMLNPGPYMMSPTAMTMDMHMLMIMYGLSDKFTVMAMLNYLDNEMDMVNRMDARPTMKTSGLGDTVLTGIYQLNKSVSASLGLSFPTGSIDEKVVMMGNIIQAPYPMQLGSGTYDIIPTITYMGNTKNWYWGLEASYKARIGENDNDYTLGDRFSLEGASLYKIHDNFSINTRLVFSDWGNIDGRDPGISSGMAPTGDPDAQGGNRTDIFFGLNFELGNIHSLKAEIGIPIQQNLDGPQMETKYMVNIFYQLMIM